MSRGGRKIKESRIRRERPMQELSEHVHRLQKSVGANGYLIDRPGGAILIDPGMPFSATKVLDELRVEGVLDRLAAIVLTHGDIDHAGAASRLARETGAVTWLSAPDARVLRRQVAPGTRLRSVLSVWGAVVPDNARILSEGVEPVPGLRVLATPGHTCGHMSLLWGENCFIGDAALVNPDGTLRQFYGVLDTSHDQATRSLILLSGLDSTWLLPGHGRPVKRSLLKRPTGS